MDASHEFSAYQKTQQLFPLLGFLEVYQNIDTHPVQT